MPVLVIADHTHSSLEFGTLTAIQAAKELESGDIHVLVAGHECAASAEEVAKADGVAKVLKADSEEYSHFLSENIAPLIAGLAKDYSHVVAPDNTFSKNVLPRAAALTDSQQISGITAVESSNVFQRPIYAGNAIATVETNEDIIFITARTTSFDPVSAEGGNAPIEDVPGTGDQGLSAFEGQELTESERPELTSAGIVVSGGRGVGSADNFDMIEKLADKLGAAVGASRAAVDAGYISNDHQVGQTGKVVAPELYIAVGISGAIQHLAGMKDSKTIVAINKDSDAPIFQVADYGLVADLFEAVPELTEKLS